LEDYVSIQDVAAETGISIHVFYAKIYNMGWPHKKVGTLSYVPRKYVDEYVDELLKTLELIPISKLAEACGKEKKFFWPNRNKSLMGDIAIQVGRFYYVTPEDYNRIVWINENTVSIPEAIEICGHSTGYYDRIISNGLPYYQYGRQKRICICQVHQYRGAEKCIELGINPDNLYAFKPDSRDDWKLYAQYDATPKWKALWDKKVEEKKKTRLGSKFKKNCIKLLEVE
jgi:hypothetical protein